MHAHILCYEQPPNWILGKISQRLCDELREIGVDATISHEVDFEADVNHHVHFLPFEGLKTKLDTLLVTHIDSDIKMQILLGQLKVAHGAVFFSRQTRDLVINAGGPQDKLTVISPPQDGIITPRKLVVGILSNTYPNYRKRENLISELVRSTDLSAFHFEIMGSGWEEVTSAMDENDVSYTLHPVFIHEEYLGLVPTLDYYLYTGMDEGSMAFLDAMAADVKTIVTPQGFHLDADVPIDHPFETEEDLKAVFNSISQARDNKPAAVRGWSWRHYAEQHLAFWQHLAS